MSFPYWLKGVYLQPAFEKELEDGAVAQLVEQRTENPCVGGSIPPHTTRVRNCASLFLLINAPEVEVL
jgi:hypothetical protein